MIQTILDIIKEIFIFIKNRREDKKEEKIITQKKEEEINQIVDNGDIDDLFNFVNKYK
jgi:hypothetical protein